MPETTGKELGVAYATAGHIYSAAIVLPILGIISLAIRWRQRCWQRQGIRIDDWLMVPSLLFTIAMGITLCIGVHGKAIGYPTPYQGDLTIEEQEDTVNPIIRLMGVVQFTVIFFLILASGCLKLSIICLYRRLFVVTLYGSPFDLITIAALAVTVVWTMAFIVATTLSCGTHVSTQWGSLADKALYCNQSLVIDNALVVSDAVTNCLIWLMPIPMVWSLHVEWPKKLAVTGILLVGSVSIVASIIKIAISYEIASGGLSSNVDSDLTVSTILYWCMIEAGIANVAATLPLLRKPFSQLSLANIIRSFRSGISLQSLHSSNRAGSVSTKAKNEDQVAVVHDWDEQLPR